MKSSPVPTPPADPQLLEAVRHVSDVRPFDLLVLAVAIVSVGVTVAIAVIVQRASSSQRVRDAERDQRDAAHQRRIDALRTALERLDVLASQGVESTSDSAPIEFLELSEAARNMIINALSDDEHRSLVVLLLSEFEYARSRMGYSNSSPMAVLIGQLQADLTRDVLSYGVEPGYRESLREFAAGKVLFDVHEWIRYRASHRQEAGVVG